MGISIGGINSGLPPNLVDQLIEAERIPIKNIEVKKAKKDNQLKLVQDLEDRIGKMRGTIGELASTRGFSDIKLISGDPNIVQGVIDPSSATPGSWNIEVLKLANKAAAITNGFPDKDYTEIGVGYFRFETPDGKKEVYINKNSNTLEGAANAINKSRIGIRATVVNDRKTPDAPYKLVISGETVGGDSEIKYPTLYFLDGDRDLYFDDNQPASNGIIKLDGFEIEVPSNELDDIIPGVVVHLKQAAPGRSINVTVKEDVEAVTGKVKEFVDTINGVFNFIQQQNKLDQSTDTSHTLGGDSILRTIESRLRRLIIDPVYGIDSKIQRINQLGIIFNRNGALEFDQEKFLSSVSKYPDDVQKFFSGDGFSTGFIPKLKSTVSVLLNPQFGQIKIRKNSLQHNIDRMDQQISRKEEQLVKKEVSLRRKFANLEESMSKLNAQGAQLAALGGQQMGGMKFGL